MRTPGHDAELVTGLLLSEGVLRRREDLVEVAPCRAEGAQGSIVNVFLSSRVRLDWKAIGRGTLMGSSCGLCGSKAIESVRREFPPIRPGISMTLEDLALLPSRMAGGQRLFKKTGGVHAAGLFSRRGTLMVIREDVGRHNAVDKVIGYAFSKGKVPLTGCALAVSGRVSFEIMQKALSAGISAVVAVSAPTSLAVEFARESGQTLAGFARGGRVTVYSEPLKAKRGGIV